MGCLQSKSLRRGERPYIEGRRRRLRRWEDYDKVEDGNDDDDDYAGACAKGCVQGCARGCAAACVTCLLEGALLGDAN